MGTVWPLGFSRLVVRKQQVGTDTGGGGQSLLFPLGAAAFVARLLRARQGRLLGLVPALLVFPRRAGRWLEGTVPPLPGTEPFL